MSDFYKVLGVSKTASKDELRSGYRALAVRWHPDKNHGQMTAEDRFKRISEAYAVLSDPEKRADYDRQLENGSPYSAFEMDYDQSMSLFFEQMIYLARDLTMDNVGYRKIANKLVKRGCPTAVALQIAKIIEMERKGAVRKQSGFNVRYAVLMLCIQAVEKTDAHAGQGCIVIAGV